VEIKKLLQSSHYNKSFKKLSKGKQQVAVRRLEIFQKNPFHHQLKTHKLSGKLAKYWSFSVDYSTRVVFEFVDTETVGLIDIGPHKIYKV